MDGIDWHTLINEYWARKKAALDVCVEIKPDSTVQVNEPQTFTIKDFKG